MSLYKRIMRQAVRSKLLLNIFWKKRPKGLYCFNFHRIGDWKVTPFDPCVYSCDESKFEQHVKFIQQNFRIVSIKEVCNIIENNVEITEHLALITFDDGYIDNYQLAYPILKKYNISATFFITTSLTGGLDIPWWDEMAWHIKQLPKMDLRLQGWPKHVSINKSVSKKDIRQVLRYVKQSHQKVEQQLNELRLISKLEYDEDNKSRLFMSWSELDEMQQNGMEIGAHSHSHEIFSKLEESELQYELSHSKALIEKNLNTKVRALSYPVGNMDTYDKNMFDEISQQGYKLAFTFCPVLNTNINKFRFELGRFSVDESFSKKELTKLCLWPLK